MTEVTDVDRLEPCPFRHGGTGYLDNPPYESDDDGFYVECGECGCRGPLRATRAEAVAAWNNRP